MAEVEKPPVIDGKFDDPAWKKAERITLIPDKKNLPVEVRTTVRTLQDKDFYYFGFECEDKGKPDSLPRPFDSRDLWKDAGVEVFLSPDRNPDRCYQIMVNASGSMADLKDFKGVKDWSWNSKAEAKSVIIPGKGWTTEIKIPRSSLPKASESGMLANLTRLYTPPKQKPVSYVWGPFYLKNNNEIEHFGTLRFGPEREKNLLKDGDFDRWPNKKWTRFLGSWAWNGGDKNFPAVSDHLLRGKYAALLDSARFGKRDFCSIEQDPPLKPDTEYELTFFVRMEKVRSAEARSSGFFVRMDDLSEREQCFPNRNTASLSGSCHWTPMTFRFRTSPKIEHKRPPRITFYLRKATGKVWIDRVRLAEVKK